MSSYKMFPVQVVHESALFPEKLTLNMATTETAVHGYPAKKSLGQLPV